MSNRFYMRKENSVNLVSVLLGLNGTAVTDEQDTRGVGSYHDCSCWSTGRAEAIATAAFKTRYHLDP